MFTENMSLMKNESKRDRELEIKDFTLCRSKNHT